MKKNKLLIPAVVVGALFLLLVGGVGWYFLRGNDPLAQAQQLMAKGDLRGAQIEYRNAVRAHPESAEAHLRLAQLQMQLADPVAAEKEFKTARDLGADRTLITPLLGQVYLAQGRYRDVLTDVPAEGPTPEATAKNLMIRSVAQAGLNDTAAATASLAEAERVSPNNLDVLLTGSRLALALRDTAKAETKDNEALAIDPKSIDGLLMKAQILAAKDDKAGALAAIDAAVEAHPDSAAARLDRANMLMLGGQDGKAQADVNNILAAQPRNAGATYLNAVLMVRAGKYADAQTELAKLGPVIQRFPRALYFQALAAANLGQTEIAIDFATRYVARAPTDPDGVRLVARTQLTAKHPELAVASLTKAIDAGLKDAQTLDLLGRAYAMMGRTQDAVDTFKRASEAAPNDATILTHLASSQMQEGNPANAAAALERSLAIAPAQPNAGEALVAAALSAGDMDKADQALTRLRDQVGETEAVGILTGMVKLGRLDLEGGRVAFANTLRLFPESANAKLNLAKVLILQNRRTEGDALLKEVLAKDPANIPTLNTAVQLLVQQSQFAPAIQLVEAARTAQPRNFGFTTMLSDLIVRSGDPRRAVGMLQAMRSNEELPPVLLAALARAQAAAGLNDEARKTYQDVVKAAPTDLDARRAQVDLMLRNNQPDAAKDALREALASSPGNIGIMSAMVTLEQRTSGFDAALKLANDLRNQPTNLPSSTVLKGDLLMAAGKYPDAAQAFLDEYRLTASTPIVLRLANALASAGKDDDATKYLREWQRATPGEPDISQMLGLLDIKANRMADAEKNLSDVLEKRPSDPVAMNNLAWVYSIKNDPRARTLAQRAYLQAPTAETADTLGWIMIKGGDSKSGLPLLQQASTQRPNDNALKYHLAVALKDSGQKDEAVKLLQAIVPSGTPFDGQNEARSLLADLTRK